MRHIAARGALFIAVIVLTCIAANWTAFWIDTDTMRQNAAQGAAMLGQEGATPQFVGGFKAAQPDNYTAVLILKTAAYTGEEPHLFKTLGGTRTDMPTQEGQSAWEAFCTYADGSLSPTGGLTYSRYWHGYTLPLRLLLCIMNLSNIQMLLFYVQLALFALVLLLMMRRGLAALAPGMLAAYFVMMPMVMGVCLQYAPVSLVMLSACVLLLRFDARIERGVTLPAFFAAVGILTNYFDLLTFPVVTLVFPLVLLMALRQQAGEGLGRIALTGLLCCTAWALGYAGMWMLKWLLTALIFGADWLWGVVDQMLLRTSSASGESTFSRMEVLRLNAGVILSKSSYLLILAGTGALTALCAARRLLHGAKPDARALPYLLAALVPVAFILVMANHAFDHTYFTYRDLAASIFAGYAAVWGIAGTDAHSPRDLS